MATSETGIPLAINLAATWREGLHFCISHSRLTLVCGEKSEAFMKYKEIWNQKEFITLCNFPAWNSHEAWKPISHTALLPT
jgi:hypothetical protein